jgi:hypothetical protein
MELSDEQKKRILEEEQQRLAEERYREQVRRELQNHSAAVAPAATPIQTKSNAARNAFIVVGILVILCIVALIGISQLKRETRQPTTESTPAKTVAPSDRPSPLSPPPPQKLTTAQIAEKATPCRCRPPCDLTQVRLFVSGPFLSARFSKTSFAPLLANAATQPTSGASHSRAGVEPASIFGNRPNFPPGALPAGIIATQWSEGRLELRQGLTEPNGCCHIADPISAA